LKHADTCKRPLPKIFLERATIPPKQICKNEQ
jgi:hypothetical protein